MDIIGLDLSLNSTGWSIYGGVSGLIVNPKLKGVERLKNNFNKLNEVLSKLSYPGSVAFVEGYSYGSVGNGYDIAEWGGVARLALQSHGIAIHIVAPSTLKKFVLGKRPAGEAKKEHMLLGVYQRWKAEFLSHDMADAFALANLGAIALGREEPVYARDTECVQAINPLYFPPVLDHSIHPTARVRSRT